MDRIKNRKRIEVVRETFIDRKKTEISRKTESRTDKGQKREQRTERYQIATNRQNRGQRGTGLRGRTRTIRELIRQINWFKSPFSSL